MMRTFHQEVMYQLGPLTHLLPLVEHKIEYDLMFTVAQPHQWLELQGVREVWLLLKLNCHPLHLKLGKH